MSVIRALLILLLAWSFAAPARAQLPPGEKAMAVRLVAESEAPPPGGKVTLALVMSPKPGWHGYWRNPGDAGLPNRIEWRLPPGVAAGPLLYPVPERLTIAGIMNYVYEGEYAQLVELTLPPGLAPGTRLPIAAKLFYLVCTDKICVPEDATVALDLVVGASAARAARDARFDRYRERLPRPLESVARFERTGGRFRIAIPIPAAQALEDPYVFPVTLEALNHGAPQAVSRRGDLLIVETAAGRAAPPSFEGVLAIGEGDGLAFVAEPGPVPPAGTPVPARAAAATGAGGAGGSILLALLGALLGGLLLNVMPCVFPILSLKALSLAGVGGDEGAARREALAYTAGLVLVCVGLGALLLALRASGAAVGWAFQLQDPRVILLLLLLVTAITLNLAGLFELPALGGGDRLTRRGGAAGAFWTGALAAFVATPCTGPFMGAAMGAALLLPSAAALAIFAGLGLGLALPFLLLGFVPALRRRLPRPGPWMAGFRRFLALPMALTAAALAWVLWRQTGTTGLAVGLGAALLVAAALWWAGSPSLPSRISGRGRGWAPLAPAALVAIAAVALAPTPREAVPAEAGRLLGAEPFSEERLAALRAEGRPVFVYFTADWCITCKVNEAGVLDRADVARAFAGRKVAVLVGDWTRGDAAIGRFLEKNGRSGVPLYLWYAPGREPEILPQILTASRVMALAQ